MKYLVLGSGKTGISAASFLSSRGHNVVVSDQRPLDENISRDLEELGVEVLIGEQTVGLLKNGFDFIVPSPGIPPSHPLLSAAPESNVSIITDIEIASKHFTGIKIGVTGTNGKSTAVSMIAQILNESQKHTVACGNIGLPILEALSQKPDILVIELSSYQLEHIQKLSLDVGVFYNFAEDHLARHGSEKAYFSAKWKLTSFIKPQGVCFVSDPVLILSKKWQLKESVCALISLSHNTVPSLNMPAHDLENALYASHASAHILSLPPESLFVNLKNFKSLPFRFQRINDFLGRVVINDSKSTNVSSTITALNSMTEPCLLLLGGASKGESFEPLKAQKSKISYIITFGAARKEIADCLQDTFSLRQAECLSDAVALIKAEGDRGQDPILFSPGCASFDEFKNFEERGFYFSEAFGGP